jgi:predicted amidohydrolase
MKVACVQCDVVFNDPAANCAAAVARIHDTEADLIVFPEAYLTGYVVSSPEVAKSLAITLDSEEILAIQKACQDSKRHAVVGTICREGDAVSNTALLVLPDGTVHRYDKTHLPFLGVDRFVTPGDKLPVLETEVGKIGLLVCYDLRVPEAARVLALAGADLIVLPTNWPEGAEMTPAHVAPARALENRVFVATCNRVGTENGTRFIGKSGIYDVIGRTLVSAGDGEETIRAEIDLSLARRKRTVIRPGEYELDVMGSRRPELYSPLLKGEGS